MSACTRAVICVQRCQRDSEAASKSRLNGAGDRRRTWLVTTSPCCVHSWTHAGADSMIRNFASWLHALASKTSWLPPFEGRPLAISPVRSSTQRGVPPHGHIPRRYRHTGAAPSQPIFHAAATSLKPRQCGCAMTADLLPQMVSHATPCITPEWDRGGIGSGAAPSAVGDASTPSARRGAARSFSSVIVPTTPVIRCDDMTDGKGLGSPHIRVF